MTFNGSNGPHFNIQSRRIRDADLDDIAAMLGKGLGYPKSYFVELLERLKAHPTPGDFPKYGYALMGDGLIVGAIILIFSSVESGSTSGIRCHVTSWYVEPDYRAYATVFFRSALKCSNVTYLNTSARPATLPIIKVQGFSNYSRGQFVTVPLAHSLPTSSDNRAAVVKTIPEGQYEPFEMDLLLAHEKYGNMSFWCTAFGSSYPFIFQKRLFKGIVPGAQLVYCRNVEDFVRFARPIGLALASRGIFVVRIDSNGPILGLFGMYFDGVEPRYYKGVKPRLGDLTYTQNVMTGHIRKPNWVAMKFSALKTGLLYRYGQIFGFLKKK
jgi:hypothetical protein